MTWLRIDDGFPEDPKIDRLSHKAFRLHVTALCYCARNLTDGIVTGKALRIVALLAGVPAKTTANELVKADLWTKHGDDYTIPKYLDYNPTSDEVKEARRKRAEAGRLGGLRSGQSRSGS